METFMTVQQIYKEVYSEVSEKIPDASFKSISCSPAGSYSTGHFYRTDGEHYLVDVTDMGKIRYIQAFDTERECRWNMIGVTILGHTRDREERERLFLLFEDEYPDEVRRSISAL